MDIYKLNNGNWVIGVANFKLPLTFSDVSQFSRPVVDRVKKLFSSPSQSIIDCTTTQTDPWVSENWDMYGENWTLSSLALSIQSNNKLLWKYERVVDGERESTK